MAWKTGNGNKSLPEEKPEFEILTEEMEDDTEEPDDSEDEMPEEEEDSGNAAEEIPDGDDEQEELQTENLKEGIGEELTFGRDSEDDDMDEEQAEDFSDASGEEASHLYPLLKPFRPEEERTPEESLAHALSLAAMSGRMIRQDYKARYLWKALHELRPLRQEMPEANKAYKKYRRKMYNARARFLRSSYRKANALKKAARTEEDYRVAAEAFEAVVKYNEKRKVKQEYASPELYAKAEKCKNAQKRADWCRRQQALLRKKAVNRRRGILAAVLILAAGLFLFSRTPQYMYLKGDMERRAGLPDKAWQAYYESYKVTKSPKAYAAYQDSRYLAASAAKASDQPADSWKDWEELSRKDYLDSRMQFVDLECRLIEKASPGDTVTFGGKEWIVLDSEGTQRLLIRASVISEIPFQENSGDCTWSSSSVRKYMNETYPEKNFSAEELPLLVWREIPPEDNRLNGNSGGEATRDRIFLLSASEAEQYSPYLEETKRCWWLRTPGILPGTMAFVNTDKSVMEYGYDATSEKIRIKPCIWIETAVPQEGNGTGGI